MKKRWLITLLTGACITGGMVYKNMCMHRAPAAVDQERVTLLIQGLSESPTFSTLIQKVAQNSDRIIKEELGLPADSTDRLFLPKDLQRLTLYTLCDTLEEAKQSLLNELDKVSWKELFPKHVTFLPEVNFFGAHKDELVIMIGDEEGELKHDNQVLKTLITQLNDRYQGVHACALYDKEKSERFPYLPHMGIGRIRINSIMNCIADPSKKEAVLEHIKQRILQEALTIVQEVLKPENADVNFVKIGILDLTHHTYVQEYV